MGSCACGHDGAAGGTQRGVAAHQQALRRWRVKAGAAHVILQRRRACCCLLGQRAEQNDLSHLGKVAVRTRPREQRRVAVYVSYY